jgi:cytochrome d ubiquinol oxidase subunit II
MVVFWFIVITILWVGFLLLEGFDFGVGMLHQVLGRDAAGRGTLVGTISPIWDGNEVWLVVAAAGTFAAFPGWYAAMFSAFYPLVLLALVALIVRGVSIEFRSHVDSARSRGVWEIALSVSSLLVPLLLGTMLGALLHGVPINSAGNFTGNLGDLLSGYAVFTGITITAVSLLHGAVFLALRTLGDLHRRALSVARVVAPVTALVVIAWAAWTRVEVGGVLLSWVEFLAVLAAIAVVPVVYAGLGGVAFAATSATMAFIVISLFLDLYPRVMVATTGAANDLTATNTAAGHYSLTVMTVVLVVLLPIVLAYQAWSFYVFRRRLGGTARPVGGPRPPDRGATEPVVAAAASGAVGTGGSAALGDGDSAALGDGDSAALGDGDSAALGDGDSAALGDGDSAALGDGGSVHAPTPAGEFTGPAGPINRVTGSVLRLAGPLLLIRRSPKRGG